MDSDTRVRERGFKDASLILVEKTWWITSLFPETVKS